MNVVTHQSANLSVEAIRELQRRPASLSAVITVHFPASLHPPWKKKVPSGITANTHLTPPSTLESFEVMKIQPSPAQTHACAATTTNTLRSRLADCLAGACELVFACCVGGKIKGLANVMSLP